MDKTASSKGIRILKSAEEMCDALQGLSQKWFKAQGTEICQSDIYSIERYLQFGVFALSIDNEIGNSYLAHPVVGVCDANDRAIIKFNSNGHLYEEMPGFTSKEMNLARLALNTVLNYHIAQSAKPTPQKGTRKAKEACIV